MKQRAMPGSRKVLNHSVASSAMRIRAVLIIISICAISFAASLPFNSNVFAAHIDPLIREQIAERGETSFWVILKEQADLSASYRIPDWRSRGIDVVNRLQMVSSKTQAHLQSLLKNRDVNFKPFWIINAILVKGDAALLTDLATHEEIAKMVSVGKYKTPDPTPGAIIPHNSPEWNIVRVNAPQVWSTGTTGQGIVVANMTSGVQFDHLALVGKYRGNLGSGMFDHNYNWFDPSNICGYPSLIPCDNNGYGTHEMGIMVGDDGGANQIGVAPGARWITAKGCESNSCSQAALIAAAQWLLAPTDLNGNNPRPDLRPHVVIVGWNGGQSDTWFQSYVQAWVASGIFPVFSVGNSGSACGTVQSPGDYPESYAVGAFDINNNIAWFSSRGPSLFGGIIKPNIAAPGVDIRSSVPPNSYESLSGTGPAGPHVAGTIALMWSAATTLIGDIVATRSILDQTAIDVSDLSCSGTAGNNNVWGEGRVDAFVAVSRSLGQTGSLQGAVTAATTGLPISDASVSAVGTVTRSTTTDASGFYSFSVLPAGSYDVSVSKAGYMPETASDVVSAGSTTVQDFAIKNADSDGDGIPDEIDACPNENAAGFDVDGDGCIDRTSGLGAIINELVQSGVIASELQTSLLAKVNNAEKSATKGNICAAVNQLTALKNQVNAQRGKKISESAANEIIAYINSVIAYMLSQLPAGQSC